ncbi:MAG: sensor histidine kinase, partial [Janthinobacterium lividum]
MASEASTKDLNYLRFPHGISPRAAIAAVSLAALLLFVAVEFGFSYFAFPTPRAMLLVAAAGALYRCAEFAVSRKPSRFISGHARSSAAVSICVGLLLPFALAAATRQFHTHYFGLLILPVLEAALYFSLPQTLAVAVAASLSAMFWVAYAAHFMRPFQLGEMLETATLVLLLFTVGTLVWSLLDLVAARDATLRSHVHELQVTRERLLQEEKLAAIGRLASAVAHEIRNPVAIICSAMEAAGSRDLAPSDQAAMSGIALTEARRLAKLTTDFLSYAQPGDLPRTEVDVLLLIGYIASIAKAQAMGRHVAIALDIADGCRLFGNEDQLQQALLNLIRNAIDASPDAGQVLIRC